MKINLKPKDIFLVYGPLNHLFDCLILRESEKVGDGVAEIEKRDLMRLAYNRVAADEEDLMFWAPNAQESR